MNKKRSLLLHLSLVLAALPTLAFADTTCTAAEKAKGCVEILSTDATIGGLIRNVLNWILGFTAALAILFIVYGGIQYITAVGNEKRVESAKQTITWAVIGLLVILLAQVIVVLVGNSVNSILNI